MTAEQLIHLVAFIVLPLQMLPDLVPIHALNKLVLWVILHVTHQVIPADSQFQSNAHDHPRHIRLVETTQELPTAVLITREVRKFGQFSSVQVQLVLVVLQDLVFPAFVRLPLLKILILAKCGVDVNVLVLGELRIGNVGKQS